MICEKVIQNKDRRQTDAWSLLKTLTDGEVGVQIYVPKNGGMKMLTNLYVFTN